MQSDRNLGCFVTIFGKQFLDLTTTHSVLQIPMRENGILLKFSICTSDRAILTTKQIFPLKKSVKRPENC